MRAYLCLSRSKDIDLFSLYKDVGTINFRKIAKLCITGIFDEKAASKAREIALSGKDGGGHSEEFPSGIKIRISVLSQVNFSQETVLYGTKWAIIELRVV